MQGTEAPTIVAYHEATKHHFYAYAMGPGGLDWATQPDPFRRYAGAPLVALAREGHAESPTYDSAVAGAKLTPTPVDASSIATLLFESLALSAWKSLGDTSWALRVNPSSGNLHPTEGYFVCGPVEGLTAEPAVLHYAPREHALERRATFESALWQELTSALPPGTLLVGLTSIHWREAWKYGERAFRYCQHDAGHAIAAVAAAAAALGWGTALVDSVGSDEIATLLGLANTSDAEPEEPECVLAIGPNVTGATALDLPAEAISRFASLDWIGAPNRLSPRHVDWPAVEAAAEATRKPRTGVASPTVASPAIADRGVAFGPLVRRRRSAVSMDGRTRMSRDALYRILAATLPGRVPATSLPWAPRVHFGVFVHRVDGLPPGLYAFARREGATKRLRAAMDPTFVWRRPDGCPDALELYLLAEGDARRLAAKVSCRQQIAADGCFSLGMLTEFESPIDREGPWTYRRLFWECGLVGQVLYLEAEAEGLSATGIGCFFDDPVHEVFGLAGRQYQSLYHFTVGGAVEDARLTTWPAYGDRVPPP